jgi:hypothetical protein
MKEKIAKLKMQFAQAQNYKTFARYTKKGKTRNVLGYKQ